MFAKVLTFTAAVLAATGSAGAVGSARVVNNCDFAISLWSVGTNIDGPHRLSANGGSYSEPFVRDPNTGGKSLKVTIPDDGLWTGAPQSNFAYNLQESQVWYDLSDVFGDPFKGHKVTVVSDNADCESIVWEDGVPPGASQVKVCTSDKDVTFTTCAD